MCEDAMVETYELELKIKEEEIEKEWASIDTDFLDECEKHRQWYLDFTKEEYHPMSYQVKKEIEEWERSAPLLQEFDKMKWDWFMFCLGSMGIIMLIGLYLVDYILF